MTGEVAKVVLVDSGFLFGLLSPEDGRHAAARRIYDQIERFHGLVLWPVLYEVMNTKLVKRRDRLQSLAALLRSPGVHRISDDQYRKDALAAILDGTTQDTGMSLVDRVLVNVLLDRDVRVDAVVTFNYRDFAKAARERRVELIGE